MPVLSSGSAEIFMAFLYLFLVLGGFLLWGIHYLLFGIGMYAMAEKMELAHPWFAFVPVARRYLQGELAGEIRLKDKTVKKPGIWMALVPAGSLLLAAAVYFFGTIAGLIVWGIGFGESGTVMLAVMRLFLLMAAILIWGGASIAVKGLTAVADYQIFGRGTQEGQAVIHAVFSILVPFYQGIYFFYLRKKV